MAASNTAKAVFLKDAAVAFLKFTGRYKGNKLEREECSKLHDDDEMAGLKADGLMLYHMYADLVMLAKSTELKKSALDMSIHHVEFKEYLTVLETKPKIIMNPNYDVLNQRKDYMRMKIK